MDPTRYRDSLACGPMTSVNVDPSITSKRFDALTATELYAILRLRCDVFVVEQECAYPDVDGRDTEPGTTHHWIELAGQPVVYARTLADPDGSIRIGRVATAPGCRGQGLAAILVRAVTASGEGSVVLDAQSHLVEWYQRLGYETCGAEYVEDGIPHVPMRHRG
jgi:ElaA protein